MYNQQEALKAVKSRLLSSPLLIVKFISSVSVFPSRGSHRKGGDLYRNKDDYSIRRKERSSLFLSFGAVKATRIAR